MRTGDKHATNRFFRRRIYAQGFTIAAMFVGSVYWETDRKKRREYDDAVKEQKAREKRDAWLRELEVRDEEERALQARMQTRRRRDLERAELEKRRSGGDHESVLGDREIKSEGRVVEMVKSLGKKGKNGEAMEDDGAVKREGDPDTLAANLNKKR